jgi:hypothetical protein
MAQRTSPRAGRILGFVVVQRPAAALVGTSRTTRTRMLLSAAGPGSATLAHLAESTIAVFLCRAWVAFRFNPPRPPSHPRSHDRNGKERARERGGGRSFAAVPPRHANPCLKAVFHYHSFPNSVTTDFAGSSSGNNAKNEGCQGSSVKRIRSVCPR